jgi:thymidylate kinase
LRDGYLAAAAADPVHIKVVDAARPIDVVQTDIRRFASEVLSPQ